MPRFVRRVRCRPKGSGSRVLDFRARPPLAVAAPSPCPSRAAHPPSLPTPAACRLVRRKAKQPSLYVRRAFWFLHPSQGPKGGLICLVHRTPTSCRPERTRQPWLGREPRLLEKESAFPSRSA